MSTPGPLADLRVVELAAVIAGPACGRYLADFGADVIKVERAGVGDSTRNMGWRDHDDVTLFWKMLGRNKRLIALDLKDPDDRDVVLRLVDTADVLIENFRPGKLEALDLGPDVLLARNPKLVVTRVSGFGQSGPAAQRPGFASIAEAMSGWAAISGDADGPPLLPPVALTDEVTGLAAAFATMVAVHSGVGQVVDVNLLETMLQLLGPAVAAARQLDDHHPRLGSGIPYTVPRGTYRCSDGQWVGISTSSDTVAARVMALVGVGDDERFATFAGRVAHRAELDGLVAAWIAERTQAEVVAAFDAAEAAIAPVLTLNEITRHPHVEARGGMVELDGSWMQGLIADLSATPGVLRWAGREMDADGGAVRDEIEPGGHGT